MSRRKDKQPALAASASFARQHDRELGIKPLQRADTTYMEGSTWENLNVLTLDGGGIRGYWTLRVLEMLMYHIGEKEINFPDAERSHTKDSDQSNAEWKGLHSFWPERYPANVSHTEHSDLDEPLHKHKKYEKWKDESKAGVESPKDFLRKHPGRRYLPCHYFDYIAGTSTGGLIAIMLGRFRMTVTDCLEEYRTLGDRVFGSPRHVHRLKPIPDAVKWDKFSAETLKEVFKDFTYRRAEERDPFSGPVTFPTRPGVCKALVATTMENAVGTVENTFFIRSYRHLKQTQEDPRPLPFGEAQNFRIWEVARAATAAPTVFKKIKIKHQPVSQSKKVKEREFYRFSDGGFAGFNNPTMEAYKEIKTLHGSKNGARIAIVVSIGTAKPTKHRSGQTVRVTANKAVDRSTDVEEVAKRMKETAGKTRGLRYFRFNETGADRGCNVKLDEWKPSKPSKLTSWLRKKKPGEDTLAAIDKCFEEWYSAVPEEGEKSNQTLIEECAEKLVRIRRDRILLRSRWERYATGAHYYCDQKNCEAEFQYRHLYNRHLNDHGEGDQDDDSEDMNDPLPFDTESELGNDGSNRNSSSNDTPRTRRVHLNECRKRWEYPAKLKPDKGRFR